MTTRTALEDRFWAKVDFDGPIHPALGTPCWLWTGKPNKGYGRFAQVGAHRVAYELTRGAIPEGQTLDHFCHTLTPECGGGDTCTHRLCVNPDHLEVVSVLENIQRGRVGLPNRVKTHCPAGHPYEGENLIMNGTSRMCRACRSARRSNGVGQGGRERARTHCPQGHPYDETNTYVDPAGKRHCRACRSARQRATRGTEGE